MLQRTSRTAAQSLSKARRFSTTAPVASSTLTRKPAQAPTSRPTTEPAKRPASTATAPQERTVPSPAFNRDDARRNEVQPLRPYKAQEMDHSFVGKTGGQIFHEMMLRHDVKTICESFLVIR